MRFDISWQTPIILKQRCKKNKTSTKKLRERERERERERITFFCEEKLCKEWKKERQIYSKMLWIRRDKIREDEGKDEEWY